MSFRNYLFLFFTVYTNIFLLAQNLSLDWKEIDSTQYEKIFFDSSAKSPKDIKSYNLENSLKQYIFVLFYKDKAIFSDPISKRGGYNVDFGRNVNFCFLASIIKPDELRKIELFEDYRVKLKYEIQNPDFLCSANYKLFSVNKSGRITKNDPFPPFLTSKIFEVVVSNQKKIETTLSSDKVIDEPITSQEDAVPVYEEISIPEESTEKPFWPTKP